MEGRDILPGCIVPHAEDPVGCAACGLPGDERSCLLQECRRDRLPGRVPRVGGNGRTARIPYPDLSRRGASRQELAIAGPEQCEIFVPKVPKVVVLRRDKASHKETEPFSSTAARVELSDETPHHPSRGPNAPVRQ